MPLLEEIGIGLYGIGDFVHKGKVRGYDAKEQEFADDFQRVMSMPDGEQKEGALDEFINKYGGTPEASQAVAIAGEEKSKLDRDWETLVLWHHTP